MQRLFDPYAFSRAFKDPVTWLALIVDLIPLYAVFALGWGAAPLVYLYWLENLVIGGVTLARIAGAGLGNGRSGIGQAVFMLPFFALHYGMFCYGHGVGLLSLESGIASGDVPAGLSAGYGDLINHALSAGPNMIAFISIITAFNVFLFVWDFIGKGEFLRSRPITEMFAPYGRIILLHVALFVGMFALLSFGEPMAGVLALIVLRVLWGLYLSSRRYVRLGQKVDAVS